MMTLLCRRFFGPTNQVCFCSSAISRDLGRAACAHCVKRPSLYRLHPATLLHTAVVPLPVCGMRQPTIPALRRQPALLRTPPRLVNPICAKRFHRHYSRQPAL
ncbi:unnamed protein product [Laminaria digitata]